MATDTNIVLRSPVEISEARKHLESTSKRPRFSTGNECVDELIREIGVLGSCLTCPVCKSLLQNPQVTPCLHVMCAACADVLFDAQPLRARHCPTCRAALLSRAQLKASENLSNIVALFIQFHPRRGSENSPLILTQVGSFSQIARDLRGTPPKPMTFWRAEEGVSQISDNGRSPHPIRAAVDASHSKTSLEMDSNRMRTEVDVSPEDDGSSNRVVTRPPFSRIGSIPKFHLSTPGMDSQVAITDGGTTTNVSESHTMGYTTAASVLVPKAEATPLKTMTTTTTPPTVRLSQLLPSTQQQPASSIATPQNEGTSNTKTPPTVKIDDNFSATSSSSVAGRSSCHPTARPLPPQFHDESPNGGVGHSSPEPNLGQPIQTVQPEPQEKKDPFRVGAIVTVSRRMGKGENRPGGVARITKQNTDGTLDVHYMVEGTREKRVPRHFVSSGVDVNADSMFGKPELGNKGEQESEEKEKSAKEATTKPMITKKARVLSPTAEKFSTKEKTKNEDRGTDEEHGAEVESSRRVSAKLVTGKKKKKGMPLADLTNRQLSFGSSSSSTIVRAPYPSSAGKDVVVVATGTFTEKKRKELKTQVEALGGSLVDCANVSDWTRVTHVVTTTLPDHPTIATKRSVKFLTGISLGLWIVSAKWVAESAKNMAWLSEDAFEIVGDEASPSLAAGGPRRAREARVRSLSANEATPLLFDGCLFAFVGEFSDSAPNPVLLTEALSGHVYMGTTLLPDEFDLGIFSSCEQRKSAPRGSFAVLLQSTPTIAAKGRAAQRRSLRSPVENGFNVENGGKAACVDFSWFLDCLSAYAVLDPTPYLVPSTLLAHVQRGKTPQ